MSSVQILPPFPIFIDVDGDPLNDGFIFVGQANQDPVAFPVSVFFDRDLAIPATQPIRTKGGYPVNGGTASRLYIAETTYSILVRNKNSSTISSVTNTSNPFIGGTLEDALNEAPIVTLASASTVNIGAASSNTISISGTAAITSLGTIASGALRRLVFQDALILTHNASSLILPAGANITTVAGDISEFVSLGSGNWRCTYYQRADGTAISANMVGPASSTDNNLPLFNGATGKLLKDSGTTVTAAGRALLDDASAAAQRTTLGVGAGDSPTFTALTLTNGQLVFPATQVPSAGANTLDDYEEGTWTPVLTFATPGDLSVVYANQTGQYTKIGRSVLLQFTVITSTFTHTTASGNLLFTGAPFAAINVRGYGGQEWRGITKAGYTDLAARINVSASQLDFIASASGSAQSNVVAADTPSGGTIDIRGFVSHIAA